MPKKNLPENVKVQTAYSGKQLKRSFKTKDKTKFEHQHEIIYQMKSSENCWIAEGLLIKQERPTLNVLTWN